MDGSSPSPQSSPLDHTYFTGGPSRRDRLDQSSHDSLSRLIDSDMASEANIIRPSFLRGTSTTSGYALVTPAGPSTPSRIPDAPKDRPHRGDLIGFRGHRRPQEMDTFGSSPVPPFGAPQANSIISMLREMNHDLAERPSFSTPSGSATIAPTQRRIAALPSRYRPASPHLSPPQIWQQQSYDPAVNGRYSGTTIASPPPYPYPSMSGGDVSHSRLLVRPQGSSAHHPPARSIPIQRSGSSSGGSSSEVREILMADEVSVPGPRAARPFRDDDEDDRIDFSPQTLGRRNRPANEVPTNDRRTPMQHAERLGRLDSFRLRDDFDRFNDLEGRGLNSSTSTSSRLGRYPLDESRDLRSRPERATHYDSDGGLDRLHQNVQAAISRRVGEVPSPAYAARRLRQITGDPVVPGSYANAHDMTEFLDESFVSAFSSQYRRRQTERSPAYRLERALGVFDTMDGEEIDFDTEPAYESEGDGVYMSDTELESDTSPEPVRSANSFIFTGSRRQMYPQSLRLRDSHDGKTKDLIVRQIAKHVARWPSAYKKMAARAIVHHMPWKDIVGSAEMERDEYCSVCHDEYEPESEIAVTRCKHMYHKDCLETPNISSCPMCRRDFAVLSCIIVMLPSPKEEEALPLWMALRALGD